MARRGRSIHVHWSRTRLRAALSADLSIHRRSFRRAVYQASLAGCPLCRRWYGVVGLGAHQQLPLPLCMVRGADAAFIYTIRMSQWSALIIGAALLPTWGFCLRASRPSGQRFGSHSHRPRRWSEGVGFLTLSLILFPSWPFSWLASLPAAVHIRAPVTFWGGPLVLMALLKWRRPEARLLAAMACIPDAWFMAFAAGL